MRTKVVQNTFCCFEKYFIIIVHVYGCVCVECVCACRYLWRSKEGAGSPRAGVTWDCEQSNIWIGNPTQVLWKSRKHCEPLSHLSSSSHRILTHIKLNYLKGFHALEKRNGRDQSSDLIVLEGGCAPRPGGSVGRLSKVKGLLAKEQSRQGDSEQKPRKGCSVGPCPLPWLVSSSA